MKIYIVMVAWGEYADHHEVIDRTFTDKSKAEKYVSEKNEKSRVSKTGMNYWIQEEDTNE